jgi:hypothetical protein
VNSGFIGSGRHNVEAIPALRASGSVRIRKLYGTRKAAFRRLFLVLRVSQKSQKFERNNLSETRLVRYLDIWTTATSARRRFQLSDRAESAGTKRKICTTSDG